MAYITHREATKKYRVTYERLVQLEREGKLRKIAAKDAGFAKMRAKPKPPDSRAASEMTIVPK